MELNVDCELWLSLINLVCLSSSRAFIRHLKCITYEWKSKQKYRTGWWRMMKSYVIVNNSNERSFWGEKFRRGLCFESSCNTSLIRTCSILSNVLKFCGWKKLLSRDETMGEKLMFIFTNTSCGNEKKNIIHNVKLKTAAKTAKTFSPTEFASFLIILEIVSSRR